MSAIKILGSTLPKPGQVPLSIRKDLRVLLLSNAVNNLTRRVQNELLGQNVQVRSQEVSSEKDIHKAVSDGWPELVICPFLTTRVPNELMHTSRPFLIMHPGIGGDRGASSLDWAILEQKPEWGVTVLEAEQEMDAGAIWSTDTFPVPADTIKTALYNGEVSDAAINCVLDAVSRFSQGIEPTSQENNGDLPGAFKRNMKHADRTLDWSMSAEEIMRRVRMSDTVPGAIMQLDTPDMNEPIRVFDAHVETSTKSFRTKYLLKKAAAGQPVARKRKGVLVKTIDDQGVWFGQMKKDTRSPALKLPFTDGVSVLERLPVISGPTAHDDIKIVQDGPIRYIHFDFYNGCMDKVQASRLQAYLETADNDPDTKIVALMGGERFFSTGIHLCVIENHEHKAHEAWCNINAIDDVIETLVNMKNKVSVAVMQGNAAAGGAMLAYACDVIVAHPGVMITPSYRSMHLFGSEYWTYFLPRRVGYELAQDLIHKSVTVSAKYALSIGMLDHLVGKDKRSFHEEVPEFLHQLIKDDKLTAIIKEKNEVRNSEWHHRLDQHREYELSQMKANFHSTYFLTAMHEFAYKLKAKH